MKAEMREQKNAAKPPTIAASCNKSPLVYTPPVTLLAIAVCTRPAGIIIRVSLADDATSPVALREETFRSTWLPLFNISRTLTFNGVRKLWTFTDSFGGRYHDKDNQDTFVFSLVDAVVIDNSYLDYKRDGDRYPWQISIQCANPVVVHEDHHNDLKGKTLNAIAQANVGLTPLLMLRRVLCREAEMIEAPMGKQPLLAPV